MLLSAAAAELRASFLVSYENHLRQAVLGGVLASTIPTPFLCIDDKAFRTNMLAMKEYIAQLNDQKEAPHVLLRPHAKMHKSARISRLLIDEGGAVGVCVQKLSEAIALSGFCDRTSDDETKLRRYVRNIYISNEVGVDSNKLRHLAQLAAYLHGFPDGYLAVCVDSVAGVNALGDALNAIRASPTATPSERAAHVHVLIEVDVGHNRAGVTSTGEDLAHVGHAVKKLSEGGSDADGAVLRFVGVHAYHGAAQHIRLAKDRADVIRASSERAKLGLDRLRNECGLSSSFVTGAGSGTFALDSASNVYRELQPGSYLVLDRDYGENEHVPDTPIFTHSLFLCASVVSLSKEARRITLDAGHKSAAIDTGPPSIAPFVIEELLMHAAFGSGAEEELGFTKDDVVQFAQTHFITVLNGGDDHSLLRWSASSTTLELVKVKNGFAPTDTQRYENLRRFVETRLESVMFKSLQVGSRVWLVPGHCDPTINLHDYMYMSPSLAARPQIVTDICIVDARGAQQ